MALWVAQTGRIPKLANSSPVILTGTTSLVRSACAGFILAAFSQPLPDTTPDVVLEPVSAAHRHGTIVSYDLNYRPSLWRSIGGPERAQESNREIARHVDVMIGNEEVPLASGLKSRVLARA